MIQNVMVHLEIGNSLSGVNWPCRNSHDAPCNKNCKKMADVITNCHKPKSIQSFFKQKYYENFFVGNIYFDGFMGIDKNTIKFRIKLASRAINSAITASDVMENYIKETMSPEASLALARTKALIFNTDSSVKNDRNSWMHN